MAYSDGLVDARSEAEEPFGLERVKEVLLELDSTELGAQATLDALVGRARAHIGGAEPFDDLTVMTLLVR
jgi:serine phosphatase RsbU (regulator of sigma subunit)